jgi:hypothetical protein
VSNRRAQVDLKVEEEGEESTKSTNVSHFKMKRADISVQGQTVVTASAPTQKRQSWKS